MLLYTCIVNSAPQESNVTFLKIQPYQEYIPLASNRTSRHENQPITISILNNLAKNNSNTDSITTFNAEYDAKIEILNQTTNVSLENNEFLRHVRSDDVTTELDQSETTTDQDIITEDDVTTIILPKTTTTIRPIPKFLPKLSYLKKSKKNSVSTNSLNTFIAKTNKPYKRKFKSRCRCEKIDNCPKLQITVPRCPDEYFLCCF